MALLDKLKELFGGGKKQKVEEEYWQRKDQQVTALEERVKLSGDVKLVTGGLEAFEASCEEVLQTLGGQQGEGEGEGGDPHVAPLLKRIELARFSARLIRDEKGDREALWKGFLSTLRESRDAIPYRIRVKYDRLRLDHESGRYK